MQNNNNRPARVKAALWLAVCALSFFMTPSHAADADLLVVKQMSTTAPAAGETFTYTIRYRCASMSELYCAAPTITDTIPAPLKIVSYTPMGGSVAAATLVGKTLTWQLATPPDSLPEGVPADGLAAGSTGMIKVQLKFPTCGVNAPPATVLGVTVPAGIDAACPTPPPAPSPGFAKTGSAAFVQPGGLERWSVSLPTSTTAYTVTENVPAGMQVYSATASNTPKVMGNPEVDCTDDGVDDFHTSGCPTTLLPSGLTVSSIKRLRWSVPANIAAQKLDLAFVVDGDYVGDGIRNCVESSQHGTSCAPLIPVLGQGEPILSISKITPTGGKVSADGLTITYSVPSWKPMIAPAPSSNDHVYRVSLGVDELSGTGTQYPILEDVLPAALDYATGQGGNWWRVSVPSNSVATNQTACQIPQFSRTLQADGRVKLRWEFPGCQLPVSQSDLGIAVYFSARIHPGISVGTQITNVAQFSTGDHPLVTCVNGADAGKTGRVLCRSANANFDVPELTTLDSVKWVKGELDSGFSRTPNTGKTGLSGAGTYVLEIRNTGNVTDTQLEVQDVLPALGDTALVTGGARQSQWSMELAGEIALQRVAVDGSVTAVPAGEVQDTSSGRQSFQFTWLPAGGLLPGEKLRIIAPVRQLAGEAMPANLSVAWNSFAYTASYYDTTTKATETLLTTEPPKVGLVMVDTAAVAGLGDYVWFDRNGDGQQDAGEPPLEGVTVRVYDGTTLVAETLTDAVGHYAFWGLLPNHAYSVKLDKAEDYLAGNPLGGMQPKGIEAASTGAAGSFAADYDFGFTLPAALGDKVWFDVNGDGAQDSR
ncbi:MAG: SdrD B-like domain-containing protein [Candidatus Thiothrix putei]|uniref:SdrD B-like domain-containing protein n=1 Tax=Candidatus Thiothrix putei TaxID=3080811 RepID=A0AA95KM58_9GAMM|nr:MAG: SdrD B-like domain-containing protein [Candidatus Thiothrix putei]